MSINAQILLEHTFNETARGTEVSYIDESLLYYNFTGNVLNIYSSNYEILNSIELSDLNSIQEIFLFSDKLFNSDGLIEFVIKFAGDGSYGDLRLYNENGEMLFDFGPGMYAAAFEDNGIAKLLVREYSPNTYSDDIYSLPGSLPVIIDEINNSELNAFPNPSSTHINIPYQIDRDQSIQLEIINAYGQSVDNILLDPNKTKFILNTSRYSKGSYIYKYGNTTGIFIVN